MDHSIEEILADCFFSCIALICCFKYGSNIISWLKKFRKQQKPILMHVAFFGNAFDINNKQKHKLHFVEQYGPLVCRYIPKMNTTQHVKPIYNPKDLAKLFLENKICYSCLSRLVKSKGIYKLSIDSK
jgi:hypothetical protein